jgi:putative ABC transport system substrate-binding protein
MLRRRHFIRLLGGAAAWPLTAHAQQRAKLPRIGFLGLVPESLAGDGLRAGLRDVGYIEGNNIVIEWRWAQNVGELPALAAELARMPVDVIFAPSSTFVEAARQATATIPIIFAVHADPVGLGHVASLARPGGNVTGLSTQRTDIAGKRLALLREIVPGLRRLAIMANVDYPAAVQEMGEIQAAAGTLGLGIATFEIRQPEDIASAFDALRGRAEALYVVGDALVITHRVRINTLALAARLPTIFFLREYVEAGGLMSYGPNLSDLFRRAADYVDKILRGAKPGDIPVEQPTKFDLIINLTTAKALGLDVPLRLQQLADEVIE